MLTLWKESYDQPRQHIKKQRHHFTNKGLSSQGYGFSSSHVWTWELDYKESSGPKNCCFWTVVLEKTLESPLDCKEIKQVDPKVNQPWVFIGRNNAEAPILWPLDVKSGLMEKTLMLKKLKAKGEGGGRGWDGWMASTTGLGMSLSKLREFVMNREAWHAVIYGVAKSQTWLSDWTELIYI